MADEDETQAETGEEAPKKASKLPMILGLVLALAGGGGGFYAARSGMLTGGSESHDGGVHGTATGDHASQGEGSAGDMPDVAFVPVDPLVVSIGQGARAQHLRFRAQLEVVPARRADVEALMPRVVDVLNSYLRALELADLSDAAALVRLRAQMLRRVQIVTGEGRVNDLLIMEFVLN